MLLVHRIHKWRSIDYFSVYVLIRPENLPRSKVTFLLYFVRANEASWLRCLILNYFRISFFFKFYNSITSSLLLDFNALTVVGALMTLIDFTQSDARRFYSSMGNRLALKGLTDL